jgi:predicted DsbA family dithiol-disulfide isomerase
VRIERLRQAYDVKIRWTAFPLHPETPAEGRSLEDLFRDQPFDLSAAAARLKSVALKEGLPYIDRNMTYNSRLAQELGKWAESQGKGEAFHHQAFQAYFADGENIAELPVLIQLAESAGLPAHEAENVVLERRFKDAVDADWNRSRRLSITAVPTFLLENRRVVGAHPYQSLEKFLVTMGVKQRG